MVTVVPQDRQAGRGGDGGVVAVHPTAELQRVRTRASRPGVDDFLHGLGHVAHDEHELRLTALDDGQQSVLTVDEVAVGVEGQGHVAGLPAVGGHVPGKCGHVSAADVPVRGVAAEVLLRQRRRDLFPGDGEPAQGDGGGWCLGGHVLAFLTQLGAAWMASLRPSWFVEPLIAHRDWWATWGGTLNRVVLVVYMAPLISYNHHYPPLSRVMERVRLASIRSPE